MDEHGGEANLGLERKHRGRFRVFRLFIRSTRANEGIHAFPVQKIAFISDVEYHRYQCISRIRPRLYFGWFRGGSGFAYRKLHHALANLVNMGHLHVSLLVRDHRRDWILVAVFTEPLVEPGSIQEK